MTRLRPLFLVAAGFLWAAGLHAQTSAIAPRIVQSIDDSNLVTLKGNVTALAQPRFDRGEADPAMQMTSVRLLLSRSKEQEAALDQFMAQQLDKSSPNYHHWLTPQEFGKLYGPADSDIAAIVAWLQSCGLTVEQVPPGRTNIAFSGSVRQIEQALHTQIHQFNADGEQFYSNISEPQIPAALAPVVAGVADLNTLRPRSHSVPVPPGKYDPESKQFVPLSSTQRLARPDLTGSNGQLYMVAADAATIYDTPNSFNANFSSGSSYTGSGVTIGIGGEALIQTATVQDYRTKFIGDNTAPTVTNVIPAATYSVNNGALGEAYLDTEVAGAMAPGAAIHYYVSTNLDNAIQQALTDNTVDIFSLSFGQCELLLTTSGNQLYYNFWQQFAAQGIAVTVSSGDSGSAGCEDHQTAQSAIYGYQVSGIASTPFNIAVGGTDFYGLLSGFSNYVSSTNGTLYRSAKSYIPESTWNSSVQSDGTLSANVAYVDSQTSKTNVDAGSGGPSSCTVNTTTYTGSTPTPGTCSSFYAKPTWQRGVGVPNDSARDIPDISLMGGVSDGAAWLICTDDTFQQNGTTYTTNCTAQSGGGFAFSGSGGTSASAPAFAGILALVQQKMGGGGQAHRLGLDGAKTLYDLYNGTHAAAIFHDITQGNNSVPCTSGTPNCKQNTAGNYFITGYDTGTGYDLATGLGSVDATQLITYWGASTGSGTSTVTVSPGSSSITTAQSLVVNISVSGSGTLGTPTGTVTLTSGTYTSGAVTLASGAASITVPSGSLAVGSPDTLTVTYSGDSNYSSTTGTATVTVTQATKVTPTITALPSAPSITTSQALTVAVNVTGTGNSGTPTGTVTLKSGSYTSSAATLSAGAASITVPAGSLATGADTLTVTYSGDSSYASATGTANVTVTQGTKLTPTVTVTPASSSVAANQSLSVSIMVSGSGAAPTGTVTLSSGTYTSSATSMLLGLTTITIPANSLSVGTDILSAAYSGDVNYSAATGTASLTVTQAEPSSFEGAYLGTTSNSETFEAIILPDNSLYGLYGTTSGNTFSVAGLIRGSGSVSGGTYTGSITDYSPSGSMYSGTFSATMGSSGITGTVQDSAVGTLTFTASSIPTAQYNFGTGASLSSITGTWNGQLFGGVSASVVVSSNGIFSGSTQGCSYSGTITPDASGKNYFDFSITYGGSPCLLANQTQTGIAVEYLLSDNVTKQLVAAATSTIGGDVFIANSTTTSTSPVSISTTAPSAISPGGTATSTLTIKASSSYSGTISLACTAGASNPSNQSGDAPTCTVSPSPITLGGTNGNSATATVSISTTAASAQMQKPRIGGWMAGGGTALALLVFFGIPARRRRWRTLLGMVALLIAFGGFSACGGGGGSGGTGGTGGGGGNSNPGTVAGTYTFTVTGTGNPSISPAPTATISLTIN